MEQKNAPKPIPVYKKYPLSRIVSVREIVSADYVMGSYKRRFPHAHQEAWEMCFCMEGEVAYYQDGREVRVRPGQVIFTSPGIIHDAYIDDPAAVSFFISFTCSDTYIQMLRQRKVRITRQQERLMERLVEELRGAFELKNDRLRIYNFVLDENCPLGAEQMICCYLEQLIIGILRDLTIQDGRPISGEDFLEAVEDDLVNRINRYIDKHLAEPLTVEGLCQEFHYGRTKISTAYKKAMGMGINTYITRQRLELAKRLLEAGEYSVTQVSEQAGFASPQYFSRKFLAAYGCAPSQYAERHRGNS